MGLDLIQECQRCLALVQEDVEDGILYMDAGAGEAFHFNGGLPSMLELGARAICSLEQASPFDAAVSWRGTELEPVEKIVILTSRLLTESHQDVIRCLGMHPNVRQCTIWTSISEEAHSAHPDTAFGLDAFHDYKNSLIRDLSPTSQAGRTDNSFSRAATKKVSTGSDWVSEDEGRKREDSVEVPTQESAPEWQVPEILVKHIPMMVCSFTKSVFVLPPTGSVAEAPLSDRRDIHAISQGIPGIDVSSQAAGEQHVPAGATLLAHCLQHIIAQMNLKCEVFTLGPLAQVVGKILSGLSSPPEGIGHPRRPAGLVLIDRSQDLITPSCHGDSLLDRIFSSLPRRSVPPDSTAVQPSHSVPSSTVARPPMDLRIPVNPDDEKNGHPIISRLCFPFFPLINIKGVDHLIPSSTDVAARRANLLGGSLSTSWDRRGSEYVETLVEKRTKDSMLLIRKWLQEALRQEKVNVPGKGRLGAVSINELRSLRRALSENPGMALRHLTLIQVARAAEEALGPPSNSHWDAFAGAERILMLSAGDSSQSIALQLQDIVDHYKQGMRRPSGSSVSADLLSLKDALSLAIVGYGLAGEDMDFDGQGGPFAWEEEKGLKESIVEAIMQGSPGAPLGFLRNLEGALAAQLQETDTKKTLKPSNDAVSQQSASIDDDWDRWEGVDPAEQDEEDIEEYGEVQLKLELRDKLEEVFNVLRKVASAGSKSPSRELRLLAENQFSAGGVHTGLLYKLLSLIFSKSEIPGLEHHASGMGRFFKGGLGRFGLRQAKPKINDQKVILVFIIGGLNFVEVREAREAQASIPGGEGTELLLGGTTVITPSDMYDLLVGSCGSM
ncbi:unnamed protein product [Calypogeia fissa]